jgi:hypothetical protein
MKLLDIPPNYLNRDLASKICKNKNLRKKYITKYFTGGERLCSIPVGIQENTGLIIAHGTNTSGKLCIIPNNIYLIPTCSSDTLSNQGIFFRNVFDWRSPEERFLVQRKNIDTREPYLNTYCPNFIINDIELTFNPVVMDKTGKQSKVLMGIITADNIPENQSYEIGSEQTSLEFNNPDISYTNISNNTVKGSEILNDTIYLSQVLLSLSREISNKNDIPNAYLLQACREQLTENMDSFTYNPYTTTHILPTVQMSANSPAPVLSRIYSAANNIYINGNPSLITRFINKEYKFPNLHNSYESTYQRIQNIYGEHISHFDIIFVYIENMIKTTYQINQQEYNIIYGLFCKFEKIDEFTSFLKNYINTLSQHLFPNTD